MPQGARRGSWLFAGMLALLVAATSLAPLAAAERERKVLYIGIDGCRFDALTVANTPHLDRVLENGCYTDQCLILGQRYRENDTISGPGWSTILTGVWADKHGVNDNTFVGKNYEAYPHIFARLKEVRPEAYAASFVTWLPIQENIVSGADVAMSFAPDGNDYSGADEQAARHSAEVLRTGQPTMVFCYIGQVDETGHKVGFHPSVKDYIAAIEQADRLVGELIAAVESRPTYEQEEWLILVTSDHGGRGTSHSKGHDVPEIYNSFAIVSGPAARRGRLGETVHLVDVPVTALAYLVPELKDEWKLDGRPIGLAPR